MKSELLNFHHYLIRHASIAISLLIALLAMSCDENSDGKNDRREIQDLLYSFQSSFNFQNISALMNDFDEDYLHNGYTKWSMRERWLDLMAAYEVLTIETLSIELYETRAILRLRLRFESSSDSVSYNAPEELGDISYLSYNGQNWRFFGNRQLVLK